MKSTDRMILLGVAVLGLVAAFWFLILAPKREQAADLESQATDLQVQVADAEAAAAAGAVSKKDFSDNYHELIALGKAVPVDADTPSLLTQLQRLSVRSDVDFRSITLASGAAGAAAPAPVTADPATATEASAALLPIGATVGTAGLPVMPYSLQFEGGFFGIADFFGQVDGMVQTDGDKTTVDGRLLTIDGFSLTHSATVRPGTEGPVLNAAVTATSYLTPADEGITAGATPTGPAPETAVPAEGAPPASGSEPAVSAAVVAN